MCFMLPFYTDNDDDDLPSLVSEYNSEYDDDESDTNHDDASSSSDGSYDSLPSLGDAISSDDD